MMMTVKDCLSLEAFKTATVVAGKRNLKNPVKTISVLDAKDVETAVKRSGVKNQMLLTSGDSMGNNHAAHIEAVKKLSQCGISALVVFHLDDAIKEDFDETIRVAEEEGLPLITIPEESNIDYADVIEQMMDKMLAGDERRDNLVYNTIYHLMDFDRHKTFQSALKEAAESNDFQVVLVSKDFNPVLVVETRHNVTVIDAVRNLQKSENIGDRRVYSTLSIEGIVAYWGNVEIDEELYFLLIVDNNEQYSAVDITKLAEVIELAMGMWRYKPERDVRAEFVKSLMRGNKSLAYTLRDDLELRKDLAIKAVFYAMDIKAVEAREVIDKFEKNSGYEIISISEENETYGIVFAPKSGKTEGENRVFELFEGLKEGHKDVRIFHVTDIYSLEDAAEAFNLIGESWHFVERVFPFKREFSKYELVLISNCIDVQVKGGRIKSTYVKLLSPFENIAGTNKAKQLMNTLETFVLDAGMSSSKTSKIMEVHANTIQYRLKRINEILGVDITANRVIPALTVALALKRMDKDA